MKNIQKHAKSKSSDQVLVILLCPYEKVKCSHRTLHTTLSHEEPSGTAPRPIKNHHFSPQSMEPDPFKQNKFYWQLVFLAYSRPRIYQRKALQDNSVYCRIISVNPGNTAFTEQQCFYPFIFFSKNVNQDKAIFIFFSMDKSWRKKNTYNFFFFFKPSDPHLCSTLTHILSINIEVSCSISHWLLGFKSLVTFN